MQSEIDGYSGLEQVGNGGTATVYKAQDGQGRIVAIKKYSQALGETAKDVIQGGFQLRKSCPEIPNDMLVYPHVGEFPRVGYYYIKGKTAAYEANYFDKTSPNYIGQNIQAARRMISETMPCLEELIKRNLAHRDIKPNNLLFREDGRITVLDYDFMIEVDDNPVKTQWGTPYYSSPEHSAGRLSPTMDVCSLAISVGELYLDTDTKRNTGISLYESSNYYVGLERQKGFKVSDQDKRKKLLDLSHFPEEVRTDVHGVICFLLEALNNDPKARPKTAEEARQLLETTPNISMI